MHSHVDATMPMALTTPPTTESDEDNLPTLLQPFPTTILVSVVCVNIAHLFD